MAAIGASNHGKWPKPKSIYHLEDVAEAAADLREGCVIDWQPGDGTRYECIFFHAATYDAVGESRVEEFFAVINLGWTVRVRSSLPVDTWIRLGLPRGSWRGLRPLLHEMGWARGGRQMIEHDQTEEFEARADTVSPPRKTEGNHQEAKHDERIGRMVRNLLEAEGYAVQAP